MIYAFQLLTYSISGGCITKHGFLGKNKFVLNGIDVTFNIIRVVSGSRYEIEGEEVAPILRIFLH
jgi:hypothetical protein